MSESTLDAAGDLFGTTANGGGHVDGTVWEIKAGTYTGGTASYGAFGPLTLDAAGNIFGTTTVGGPDGDGSVFEITGGTDKEHTVITLLTKVMTAITHKPA